MPLLYLYITRKISVSRRRTGIFLDGCDYLVLSMFGNRQGQRLSNPERGCPRAREARREGGGPGGPHPTLIPVIAYL